MEKETQDVVTQLEGVKSAMLESLQKQREESQSRYDELKASSQIGEGLAAEFKEHQRRLDEVEAVLKRPNGTLGEVAQSIKSYGQQLVEADDFKRFAKNWTRGATCIDIEGSLFHRSLKTLVDSTAVGSSIPGILVPERVGGIIKPPQRRLRVRDLIPWGTTTNNAVEYIKEDTFTNAASPVEEGSEKPESALTFTIEHADVQCIAHWIPATRQILDDFSQLQAYIDTRLLDGLADVEDEQLLNGSGVGQNLNGILTQATNVVGTYAVANDTYIDQIARAITELEYYHYMVDGIVVHPADWRRISTVKTNDGGANTGMYLLGGPGVTGTPTLWDTPVVRCPAMAVGTFLVGQFTGSVFGFDRMKAQIAVSTEHEDYFIKNKVAIRAEERLTVAVYRPDAFRHGTFA